MTDKRGVFKPPPLTFTTIAVDRERDGLALTIGSDISNNVLATTVFLQKNEVVSLMNSLAEMLASLETNIPNTMTKH